MEGKDNIKELFSQKLGNYEAKVNPELWAKISSQVAAGATTTAATGLSVFAKVAIGLGVSAAAIATVVVLTTNRTEDIPLKESQVEVKEEGTQVEETSEAALTSQNQTTTPNETQSESDQNAANQMQRTVLEFVNKPYMPSAGDDGMNDKWEFKFESMPTKGVESVKDNAQTEPQIVEGKVHLNTTNYGGGSNTDSSESPEVTVVKAEPIKRFVNVFTPNGDSENDEFFLVSEGLTDFSIVVFNPKGDIVFKSNDPNFRWDGRDMKTGEMVPTGDNYMYMVSAYDSDGNPYPIYERLRIISN